MIQVEASLPRRAERAARRRPGRGLLRGFRPHRGARLSHLGRSLVHRRQSLIARPSDGVTLYSRTIAVNPGSSMAHNDLGQVLEEQGRLEDALLHYRAAAKGLSRPLDPMVNIGHVLDKQGRYDEAI